jgi:ABC-2 type transport system ATP-binding protein
VRSGYADYAAIATTTSVLAAGVGSRRRWGLRHWGLEHRGLRHGASGPGASGPRVSGPGAALRAASFRLDTPLSGTASFGIAIPWHSPATALVDLLAGLARPAYGELRVLGEDLTTARGRSAVRGQVGVARRAARPQPAFRVRGLVEHAARLSRLPPRDRDPLAAAIVDRLSLTPWADVPVRAVPDVICRRARLAAAAVHQPDLLLIDGLLDDLSLRDASELADAIRDLGREMTIVATGRDPAALALACAEILTMADGIVIRPPAPSD